MKLSVLNLRNLFFSVSLVLLCPALFAGIKPFESLRTQSQNVQNEDSVYAVPDKMPQFPGGDAARVEFIKQHLQYPDEAQKNHEEGRVIVQFVVNSLGEIKKAKVVRSVSPSLNAEALRLINSFPAWIPGEMNGQKVSVYQVLPVSFKYVPIQNDSTAWDVNDSTVILIDTLKMPLKFNLNVLNPRRIASIQVLKPFPEATKTKLMEQYGAFAKNGVILIKTKNLAKDSVCACSDSTQFEMPKFPGGDDELMSFLAHRIRYPVISMENEVQGKVIVGFVIGSNGKVKNIRILQSLDPFTDGESMRLVSMLPDWLPGTCKGKPIDVKYTLPINFGIEGVGVNVYVGTKSYNQSNGKEWERNNKTIILLDGERLPSGFDLQLFSMENLNSYLVQKPENKTKIKQLVTKYGKDAENGVILITSKKLSEVETTKSYENRHTDSLGDKVWDVVEQMPQFPGGDMELMRFLSSNVKYPVIAQENKIEGKVIVRFIVNSKGQIENAEVIRGCDPLLDKEALRVIRLLPDWIPGKQKGVNVSVNYSLPVAFRLEL